jgi:hypothetical protein
MYLGTPIGVWAGRLDDMRLNGYRNLSAELVELVRRSHPQFGSVESSGTRSTERDL